MIHFFYHIGGNIGRGGFTLNQFALIEELLPNNEYPTRGGPPANRRDVIIGIRWVLRPGSPWKNLPTRYGS